MSLFRAAILSTLAIAVNGDVYLHGFLKGSNNRNCRNDNNDERRNANRLFDSQNNDDGGYSCPRRYPFTAENNGQSGTVDPYGRLTGTNTLDTPTFWVYGGSEIQLEWTNQHGAGLNPNLHTDVVWQYMTDDEHGDPMLGNQFLRDGTPVTNNDADNTNDEATTRIGGNGGGNNAYANLDKNDVSDGRYGYHENIKNFEMCAHSERNKGLFTADQNMQGNRNNARYTRQDNNANRYGFECNEERDYYPYWRPSPWHDIAIITTNVSRCETMQAPMSQNVVQKCQCYLNSASENDPAPITEDKCAQESGTWTCVQPWNSWKDCGWGGATWECDQEPQCLLGAYSRDNHLGNQMVENLQDTKPSDVNVNAATFTWTVPEFTEERKVVLRLRYNITTLDFDMDTTDSRFNGENSPIVDRDEREELSYYDVGLAPTGASNPDVYKLSIAVNSDQHARTFEDRTYVFIVKPVPSENANCRNKIKNLGLRGKRGNIVQAYPSVEYDFVPQDLHMTEDDCLHTHWIGSDYNPNRNPNNGEGGPYQPNNQNEAKADRTNLVQIAESGHNLPMHMNDIDAQDKCFWRTSSGACDWDAYRLHALLDQDMSQCRTVTQLKNDGNNPNNIQNNRQARERDPRNCGKLNGGTVEQSTPFFDGGLHRVKKGEYKFMSSRNNNFSNRSQKMKVTVTPGKSSALSGPEIAGVVMGTMLIAGALVFAGKTMYNKRRTAGGPPKARPATVPARPVV